jgi:hypothetical protein
VAPPRSRRRVSSGLGVNVTTMTSPAVEWLLESDEPAIRYLTRRDVLGEDPSDDEARILDGPKVRALLAGQQPDGGFGGHPYRKWGGAHWRLVSLVELAVPAGEPRAVAATEPVLAWLTSKGRARNLRVVNGLVRRCASQEGNALAVCSRLGLAEDPRVEQIARSLVEWQWPDGGWNCDDRASGRSSSFHESLGTTWGLHEYAAATGAGWAREAAERAAEMFLSHRLFRSLRTGKVLQEYWLALHYPPYWRYDILQGLLVLSRLGKATDPRTSDAYDVLLERRLADGRWQPGGYWWKLGDGTGNTDVVDWGRGGPNEMITLNALRVLAAADRLEKGSPGVPQRPEA